MPELRVHAMTLPGYTASTRYLREGEAIEGFGAAIGGRCDRPCLPAVDRAHHADAVIAVLRGVGFTGSDVDRRRRGVRIERHAADCEGRRVFRQGREVRRSTQAVGALPQATEGGADINRIAGGIFVEVNRNRGHSPTYISIGPRGLRTGSEFLPGNAGRLKLRPELVVRGPLQRLLVHHGASARFRGSYLAVEDCRPARNHSSRR